jgi:hypothetical protein
MNPIWGYDKMWMGKLRNGYGDKIWMIRVRMIDLTNKFLFPYILLKIFRNLFYCLFYGQICTSCIMLVTLICSVNLTYACELKVK